MTDTNARGGRCDWCAKWVVRRETRYEDGSTVVNFQAPEGKGHCELLNIDTAPEFGCAGYAPGSEGYSGVEVSQKTGAPWQYSHAGPCPDCNGKGNSGDTGCHRCAGTGKVRHYDDGYVGEERTRLHPKERAHAEGPKCRGCGAPVMAEWIACPKCGARTEAPAETEVVPLAGVP